MKLILELILTVSIFILKQKNMAESPKYSNSSKICVGQKLQIKMETVLGGKKKELLTTMRKIKVIKRVT